MSSPYPRDDFDAVTPPRDGRRGAHRAAPRRRGGVLAPVVIALVVLAAGGAGWVAFDTVGNPASASSASGAAASGAPAAAAQPADDAAQPADDAAGAADPAASQPAPSSSAPVDRSTPVVVLNGTGTSGLAAREAEEVEGRGWTVSSTGNATGAQRSAHSATTVLHPTAGLQAAAEALAAEIGAEAALDPKAPAGALTVVLR